MNVVEELRLPGLEQALGRVEDALSRAVQAGDALLSDVAGHLAAAGGKRLRPALVISSAHACSISLKDASELSEEVIQGGVAVELVHLGSLYHDDVMDEAEHRRGVQSVNARWGNLVAILSGDFLLARASEVAASLGTEVATLLARTIARLCEGEVTQLTYAFNTERPESAYLSSIAGKTASLIAASARLGALTSGAPPEWVDALTEYGHATGMAFQIWDDVRDLVSSEDLLGKPACHDMVEGTYTLPVIRALAVEGVGDDLRALLGRPLDFPTRDKARDLILSTTALEESVGEARRWVARADGALQVLRSAADGNLDALERLDFLGQIGHRLLDTLAVP